MPTTNYLYELRQGNTVVATGRLSHETPFEVGERVRFDEREGIVQTIQPTLDPAEQRLVIQLLQGR